MNEFRRIPMSSSSIYNQFSPLDKEKLAVASDRNNTRNQRDTLNTLHSSYT